MKTLQDLEKQLADIQKEVEALKKGTRQFEVGDWVKYTPCDYWLSGHPTKVFRIKKFSDEYLYIQPDTFNPETNANTLIKYFTKATESEIKEALVKEAEKRGFKEGVVGVIPCGYTDGSKADKICKNGWSYNLYDDALFAANKGDGGLPVYHKGVWTTIQKEQPIMIGGDEVIFYPGYITVNAFAYDKKGLEMMYQVLKLEQVRSLNVGCNGQYKVDIDLISKILEKLK